MRRVVSTRTGAKYSLGAAQRAASNRPLPGAVAALFL
jgi:hypothetical protein